MESKVPKLQQITSNSSSKTLVKSLPDELIFHEILPRVPAIPLIRFKLVSKKWLSTISPPDFTKTHLKFSTSRNQFFLLHNYLYVGPAQEASYSLLPYSESYRVDDMIKLRFFSPGRIRFVGSCNGIVCNFCIVDEKNRRYFCLWNPATHLCRYIKNPSREVSAVGYGFGYVSMLDDYNVVAAFLNRKLEFHGLFVFSMRKGSWRRIDQCGYGNEENKLASTLYGEAVLVGDTFYWVSKFPGKWHKNNIVRLNLVSEKVEHFPGIEGYIPMDLDRYKWCLSMRCWKGSISTQELLFSMDNDHVFLYFRGFSETGKCLVIDYDEEFKLVDPLKVPLHNFLGINHMMLGPIPRSLRTRVVNYIDTLISPYG